MQSASDYDPASVSASPGPTGLTAAAVLEALVVRQLHGDQVRVRERVVADREGLLLPDLPAE